MSTDFGKYAAEASTDDTPIDVEIKDRDGEVYTGKAGASITFQVVGEYSKEYRRGDRRLLDTALKRARQGAEIDADEVEESGLKKIANAVVGWTLEDSAGVLVPFSRANVVAFFEAAPWVAKQIEQAIKGHSRFFKRASAS